MTFSVAADGYDRFIGRYSRLLAPRFLEFSGVASGPVLDVGCGPGYLTAVLADRFAASQVAAIDPTGPFIDACRARVPGADVRIGTAESLPFADASFAGVLSQLVISFVPDAPRFAAEAARVTRPGGSIAACTWAADGFALVQTFWRAALRFDPDAPDDARLPFRREGELAALWTQAGFREVEAGAIDLEVGYLDFADFWEPFATGGGPTTAYLRQQDAPRRDRIRDACFELLGRPPGPFRLPARALAVRGRK
jgi:SAM-dependent methyltransferase